jgi:hypothetical protein
MNLNIEKCFPCEVCLLIRLSKAKNVCSAEIHRQIVEVYGEDAIKGM